MRRYSTITVLTGAGISAESGLPTFRDEHGSWAGTDPARLGSAAALQQDRASVIDFFNMRRRAIHPAAPNAAHRALAALERGGRRRVRLVTQNIDTLHEQAGSREVQHLHGEIGKLRCTLCGDISSVTGDQHPSAVCSFCDIASLRPHVVLFGEAPLNFAVAKEAAMACDLFLSIGTSGAVQPASRLAGVAKSSGAETVSINLYPQKTDTAFDGALHGAASNLVSSLVECLLENRNWRDLLQPEQHSF